MIFSSIEKGYVIQGAQFHTYVGEEFGEFRLVMQNFMIYERGHSMLKTIPAAAEDIAATKDIKKGVSLRLRCASTQSPNPNPSHPTQISSVHHTRTLCLPWTNENS